MYLNKVFLYGNLTRDPEIRALPSGQQVASFGLATNRTYKDRDGNKKDTTEFHNIVAFGRQADLIGQYMKKGRPIFVEGRIQTRSWDDKNSGEKKYRTEIVIENFQFGPGGQGDRSGGQGGYSAGRSDDDEAESAPRGKGGDKGGEIEYPQEDISPEDIPF
ncbi:MAG: single-stranded DNA-binding protein [Patescibacteria group bacterium]|nr:single-stranded DNA-binding protein [Patescibacteria group bacterium]